MISTRSARSIEPDLSSSKTRFNGRPAWRPFRRGLDRESQQIPVVRERIPARSHAKPMAAPGAGSGSR